MSIEHYYYLIVNLGCLIIPLAFSFHPKILFYKNWKALFTGILFMMAIFIPWDMLFTSLGVWGFNNQYISGIFIFNLPIEEFMFFICIPFASLFTYHCVSMLNISKSFSSVMMKIAWILACLSIIIAFTYYDRYYTSIAHLLCGLILFYHLIILKSRYLSTFMLTYIILLIPFIISNGILTGITFWQYPFINLNPENISDKIVWYNNEHNLSLRLFTMPVDDLSYGLLMLLLITTIYEKKRVIEYKLV